MATTTLDSYGFKPHGASEKESSDTEKTVSCKVGPEIWARWKAAQKRLLPYGEISLTGVVRSSFLDALDKLEVSADEMERNAASAALGRGMKNGPKA